VQHFAAGAMLAAIALDVLPAQHQQGHLSVATAGFAVGTAVPARLRQLEAHADTAAHARQAKGLLIGLLIAVGVDLLTDGILVGLSVATLGRAQGVALTIALTLVIVPLALSVSGELFNRGAGEIKAALIPPLLSLGLVLGAIGAVVVLGSGPAALLFLVAEELLVEAHETVDTPLLAAMLFVGSRPVHRGREPVTSPADQGPIPSLRVGNWYAGWCAQ